MILLSIMSLFLYNLTFILNWGWKIIVETPAGVFVGLDFREESNR